jgi:regulator of sigma E protease
MGLVEILFMILGISVLVIVHESGHYLVARAFKMRVLRYSIGFGPALFRYKPKDSPTTFQVCAIPFLAYVQIAGMNPHEDVDPDDPEIFPNKGLFARIATIAAGPGANYIAAAVIAFFLAMHGWPTPVLVEPMTVGEVVPESAAADAGILPDDIIVEANGKAIEGFVDLLRATQPRASQTTEYVVRRGDETLHLTITPQANEDGDGKIGVAPKSEWLAPMPVGEAALYAITFPYRFTAMQIDALMHFNPDDLRGPAGMAQIVSDSIQRGFAHYALTLAVLSIALGFFNLLPIPALDGGRLVFLGYEAVTRKAPNAHFEAMVHTVGILFLLTVLVLVTYRDIARWLG